MLTRRADATRKHEIELLWFPHLIVSVRIFDGVFPTEFTQFRTRVIVELSQFCVSQLADR
jgi:hypothetical protein